MIYLDKLNVAPFGLIVRDDLYPFLYGGNKARKAKEYEQELIDGGYNALVTTGGVQSNHCRAIALLAAKHQWDCHIVYHGNRERFMSEGGNARMVRATPATFEFVETDRISYAMDDAIKRYKLEGKKPYYITGGGHDLAGGIAYVKATTELIQSLSYAGISINRVFLPCGTGSTQAGILVGLEEFGAGNIEVIGISVARLQKRATEVTKDFVYSLAKERQVDPRVADKVVISDDYLFGGYEGTSKEMMSWLSHFTQKTGIFFDTTYSGKALWGMKSLIEKNSWESDNNLFWHTGGLLNILI